jgi:hypothetical protein
MTVVLAATRRATAATTCTDSINGDLPGAWAATVNHTVPSSSGVVTDGDMTLATRLSGTPTVLDGDVAGGQVVPQNPGATGCVTQYCTVTLGVGVITPNDAGSGPGSFAGTLTHHRRSVLGRCLTYSATIHGALTLSN